MNFKKYKSSNLVYLTYLFILSLMISGVTFSKYISSTVAENYARVIRFGELYITNGTDFYEEENIKIVPGAEIKKNLTVNFDGSEAQSCVFLKINSSYWTYDSADRSFSYILSNKKIITWNIGTEWNYLKNDGTGDVFYIFIQPNTKLSQPIVNSNTIYISKEIKNSDVQSISESLNLKFGAFAVQCNNFENDTKIISTSKEHAALIWDFT